jgi:transcriptional regulator with XRE-family HTH domain
VPRGRSPQHARLGDTIRRLREEQGLSQEDLAHKSGLHRNYIGGIERGERNPTYANLLRIAKAIGLRLSELVTLAGE